MTPEEKKVSFYHQPLKARAAIVAAGPIANFILAAVLFAVLFMFVGVPDKMHAGIGEIVEGSAAQEAGLETGDRILELDGVKLDTFDDLREVVIVNPGTPLNALVQRGGDQLNLVITPKVSDSGGEQIGLLGVRPDPNQAEFVTYNPFMAVWMGIQRTYELTGQILSHLGKLLIGQGNFSDLGGPLKIAQVSGQAAEMGFDRLIYLMAVLSINLGLINLFPIPMLDGGHLVFYAAEAIRGKPLSERVQEYGFRIGLTLVLGLMVAVTWNDIVSFRWIESISQLFT